MRFDAEGHLRCSPVQLWAACQRDPVRSIDDFLVQGTPVVFEGYGGYRDFLSAVSKRIGVHPSKLFVRGSSKIGFSIAPRVDKVWQQVTDASDVDLAIVDAAYFDRVDDEAQRWERRNDARASFDRKFNDALIDRGRDRAFHCCRDYRLPESVCVHHQDVMSQIRTADFCGVARELSAFIFKDWWSLRRRYEVDLRDLSKGIGKGVLPEPGDQPLPR